MPFDHVPAQLPSRTPCKIAFVAEAPADYEVLDGKPLVGPSGRLFDKLCRMAGIERHECLVTNVVDVQAPDNKIEKLLVGKKELPTDPKAYTLSPATKGSYLPVHLLPQLERLKAEIEACRPNLVVCLGGFALWAFTGAGGIKNCRGTIQAATTLVPGQKILATYHPAFTFHSPQMFPILAMDFAKASRECGSPTIVYPRRHIVVEPTIEEVEDFALMYQSRSGWEIGVDIETIPAAKQIKCIAFAPDSNLALVVPFVDSRKKNRSYWLDTATEVRAWLAVKTLCENSAPKVLQNGLYDFRYLYDIGIGIRNYRFDTRLEHHAMYPEMPKDLGTMESCYLNDRPWKMWRGARDGRKREE